MEKNTQNTQNSTKKPNMAELAKALNQNMGMEKPKQVKKSGKK